MRCPYCGYRESKVVDSRPADEGASIRRRRECLSCEKRFTTYETVEYLPMVVIKKDGSRQSFDRSKVLRGIQRSCEKRPVSAADMERMASDRAGAAELPGAGGQHRGHRRKGHGEAEKSRRGGLCPVRLGVSVRDYQHLS